MERWQFIGWGIAASVLAHILLAGTIVLSTDVRTYDQAAPDPIPVDVVTEAPEKAPEPIPTPTPTPSPDLTLPNLSASPSPQPASSQQAAAQPAPQPQPSPQPQPTPRETAKPQAKTAPQSQPAPQPQTSPSPQPQAEPQPAAPPASPAGQGYIPAQPDLTVKYGVMLGLPETLPPLAKSADNHDDDKDAGSTATSNLATDLVTAFRDHLRSCSRLPASISSADNVRVKLRVIMRPDGRLAAEPDVIEVVSPLKALQLKQAAVTALAACQPYGMLPPDRYREWRVLELSFTPQDFTN